MNTFVNSLMNTRTVNGMAAKTSTGNAVLDFFSSAGAMRGKNVLPLFWAAVSENPELALRTALWLRDIRGGAGERELFRSILRDLAAKIPEAVLGTDILLRIGEVGRLDDLFVFEGTTVEPYALSVFCGELLIKQNGLAAKWAPRKGAIAAKLADLMGMTAKEYRHFIVKYSTTVEQQMCAKNWNEINFSHVPSQAMKRYMKAFQRNAPERFSEFKSAVANNTAKINAGALFPYDIVKMLGGARDTYSRYGGSGYTYGTPRNLEAIQGMWDSLPDYMNGKNVISVVDNSSSMVRTIPNTGVTVLDVAASLGMYTAQRSKGAFKDLSISFSENAAFCYHKGNVLDRLQAVTSMKWGTTNLHSVFNLILDHAIKNRVPQEDMPETVVIFSDMQFNSCVKYDDSAIQMIRRRYEVSGYPVPQVVFWNLADYGNKPAHANEHGVALVSGFSPSLMKSLLSANPEDFTPKGIMMKTIMNSRYDI